MSTVNALMFTAYMIPVGLLDNLLKPVLMARGLATPMPVIVIGVIGGTIAYGIIGLFFGPIVLSVAWELITAWLYGGMAHPRNKLEVMHSCKRPKKLTDRPARQQLEG